MDTLNLPLEDLSVRVVLTKIPDAQDEHCVVDEDRHIVDATNEETTSFSFDQVLTIENIQTFHPDFLQLLAEFISSGYNGTLLIGGASRTGKTGIKIEHDIIKQVLTNIFSLLSSGTKELFITVSVIQFYPDDSVLDLLNPKRQALKPVCHPILGCLVEGLCEVSVCSAEEAYALYETGRERLEASYGSVYSRSSMLFSVAVEWRLHSDNESSSAEFCRARLQLFSLAGGASKTDLKGVSPLVKVLDQIQSGGTTNDKLLSFLLMDALTGNSRTFLLYFIPPQGLLDNETPSALILAQRMKGLVTKATVGRWCPRATEQETRDNIQELRTIMMLQEDHEGKNTYRLAQLTRNLQIIKDQSWEKRGKRSEKTREQMKGGQTTNKTLSADVNQRETPEKIKYLQEKLRQEMERHIREGKGNVEDIKERVSRIQQLREALRQEMVRQGFSTDTLELSQQSQFEYNKALERQEQIKKEHRRLIQEEMEKMERELEEEKMEGPQRELQVLAKERQILALQMEALRTEAQQAERDLEEQYHRHQHELHSLRDESLQVFKVFRQVSEEQRRTLEARYRSLLLESVQDAVHLSAQNQQLQADNKELRSALGELKDTLAVRSNSMGEHQSKNKDLLL